MNAVPGSGPVPYRLWLVGALALLPLTACATARPAEGGSADPETVDIGYGEVDKDQLVGSVSTVRAEEEQAERFRTLAEMLSRVPGVRVTEGPGGRMSVRVRGTSSFMSDQEPLFVIDGMAIQSGAEGLTGIDPNTIASITVLKDAGETAVYGVRGANGVILIKTKRGSK